MNIDYIVGLILSVMIIAYLFYVIYKPEKF
ncbi:MAG: K(+)-transporting ATPase subunit F [Ignavibacteriae bacterium]|nr:K(+)-transporting ATPase subunit F [Ignavibacteriota bacterium]